MVVLDVCAKRFSAESQGAEASVPASTRTVTFLVARSWLVAIGMTVLSENKALLRHRINCLGADFAG